ncbi:hypothetical protein Kpho02_75700 [Kitasatospora phosalacinea]|uniref:Uncharacterized protein n=1 Tax=Kitasatospora phosalacinea TaxID=2065 RepID=A0A9W6V6G4_9ACTN|nr:hypothetical protein [Kitasatospora phosalacinea]GLW75273.1 hypothetical protein Kpho02_75700 [Kitasatospora phosalacinea]
MGATFYVSADRSAAPAWPFTEQQLVEAVRRHWPESTAGVVPRGALEIDVRVGDERCAIVYHHDLRFFAFRDREPLEAPVLVLHTLLKDLAPTTPAVRWSTDDGSPEPFDLRADAAQVAEDFGR